MSNNKFLANESTSVSATKLSAWDNTGVAGEKIPANVPTNPDGTAHAQALTNAQLRASAIDVAVSSAPITTVIQPTGSNLHTVVDSGSITANAGTNLNTSLLALDSTVAKDSSLGTINTSINTLLKPASTLSAVTTVGSIANTVVVKADTLANQTSAFKVDGSAVTQPISGTITSNIGTTNGLALDASISTLNTSINTLLKPSSTLTKVTTVDSITNPVAVTGTFFQATQPVSIASSVPVTGPLTDAQLRAAAVPVSLASTTITNFPSTQAVSNTLETAATGTITSVANSVSSVTVLASNASRKGFIIVNDSTATVSIAFSATATATAFTIRLTTNQSYFSTQLPIYRGVISAISSAATGSLRITELS